MHKVEIIHLKLFMASGAFLVDYLRDNQSCLYHQILW